MQEPQPHLETERLLLRPFHPDDAAHVALLAGDKRIADVTACIPHPYSNDMAVEWILTHPDGWSKRESAVFAVVLKDEGLLIGFVSLMNIADKCAELGYWIGVEYWNQGCCTEACRRIVEFGFSILKLHRIVAHHMIRNPASGRVLCKAGFVHVGSGEAVCGYRQLNEGIEVYEILKR